MVFTTQYSTKNALFLAKISKEIYKHAKEINIEKIYMQRYGFKNASFHSIQDGIGKKSVDLQYCILHKEDLIVIVFKGSYEKEDWITNLRAKKTKFRDTDTFAHCGFQDSLKVFLNNSGKEILETKKNIVLTGHSLGGAIATLLTAYLKSIDKDERTYVCYTFGAPPIGWNKFHATFKDINLYRIVNKLDPVPSINIKLFNIFQLNKLRHVGKKIVLKPYRFTHHPMNHYLLNLLKKNNSERINNLKS